MAAAAATLVAIRVLVVALEFTDPIFSGNGIFGRSLVTSMATEVLAHHHDAPMHPQDHEMHGPRQIPVIVDVICARPVDGDGEGVQVSEHDAVLGHGVRAVSVPVPARRWRRLDRQGPWREFAQQVETHRGAIFTALDGVADLGRYSAVMAVDYTGAIALHKLVPQHELSHLQQHDRLHFLNFRVFAASAAPIPAEERQRLAHPHTFDQWWAVAITASEQRRQDPDEHPDEFPDWLFYATIEAIAGKHCSSGFALCRSDVEELIANTEAVGLGRATEGHWRVLLPPIRRDMAALARQSTTTGPDRPSRLQDVLLEIAPGSAGLIRDVGDGWDRIALVTCVVRLDPAKEALRFPEVVAAILGAASRLARDEPHEEDRRIVAFVAGAAGDRAYAAEVVAALCGTGVDVVVAESFLNAPTMAAVYAGAALNVHPSAYEAYGMTIVEAAACGVPTLVHHSRDAGTKGGLSTRVGAAGELLLASAHHVIPVAYDDWLSKSGGLSSGEKPTGGAAFAEPSDVAAMLLGRPVRSDAPRLLHHRHSAEARRSMSEKALSYTEADLARTVLQHIAASASHPPHHGGVATRRAHSGAQDEL